MKQNTDIKIIFNTIIPVMFGILSAAFGLNALQHPVLWLVINVPICIGSIILGKIIVKKIENSQNS